MNRTLRLASSVVTPSPGLGRSMFATAVRRIGPHREYGFDSINLMDFGSRVQARYQISLTPTIFFEYPTLGGFAQHLVQEHEEQLMQVLRPEGLAGAGVVALGSDVTELHPLQTAFAEEGAAQCGYCTPGMLMVAKALLDANPKPTRDEIALAISGNLCRCTGYTAIYEAIEKAAQAT